MSNNEDASASEIVNVFLVILLLSLLFVGGILAYKIYQLRFGSAPKTTHKQRAGQYVAMSDEKQNSLVDESLVNETQIDYFSLKIGRVIGEGDMGKVYKARWRNSDVCLKVVHHTAREADLQFHLRQMSYMRHPNLVLFMAMAIPGPGRVCLVYDYIDGGNLDALLKDENREMDWKTRARILLDIARGLAYLHSRNMVHRKLTPANVLVTGNNKAYISDYGMDILQKCIGASAVSDVRKSRLVWTAPEVLRHSEYTQAADVYSFGILFWQMLTRMTPYLGQFQNNENLHLVLPDHVRRGNRPLLPSRCPRTLKSLISQCWHADPSKRPSTQVLVEQLSMLQRKNFDIRLFIPDVIKQRKFQSTFNVAVTEKWMIPSTDIQMGELLGQGSLGDVHAAEYNGMTVAIKHLSSDVFGNEYISDFVHEMNILTGLDHPNLVRYLGAIVDQHTMALVLDFCSKGNLFDMMQDTSAHLDYDRIIDILEAVASSLEFLHTQKPPLVHRDLKSLNVLLNEVKGEEKWGVKIADFGLSQFKAKETETLLSSPFWLAPEVLESQAYSPASDIYAFAIITWELFTRQVPFQDMTPHQAALSVVQDDNRPDIPTYVPQKFKLLIRSCWARDPSARPPLSVIKKFLGQLRSEGIPRIELSLDNARLYRKKILVFALPCRDPCIVYKSWGTGQSKPGDYLIVGANDDVYSCDREIFQRTYAPLPPPPPNQYRKIGTIFALEMKDDYMVETMEGMEHAAAGSFLAQNPVDGEQWPISRKTFLSMYEENPEQVAPERAHERHLQLNCVNGPNYVAPSLDLLNQMAAAENKGTEDGDEQGDGESKTVLDEEEGDPAVEVGDEKEPLLDGEDDAKRLAPLLEGNESDYIDDDEEEDEAGMYEDDDAGVSDWGDEKTDFKSTSGMSELSPGSGSENQEEHPFAVGS